jgi:hypothetical protein
MKATTAKKKLIEAGFELSENKGTVVAENEISFVTFTIWEGRVTHNKFTHEWKDGGTTYGMSLKQIIS